MAAPTLKMKYAVSVDAMTLRITDITGAYLLPNNGWGAPNWELDETALFAVVKRLASSGDEYFVPKTTAVTTNPTALNADETAIEFTYLNDGVFEITLGALRVSSDGVQYLNSDPIVDQDYFYWANAGTVLWKMEGVTPTAVDIEDLVGEPTVAQITTTDILEPRLAIVKQKLYKQYRLDRDEECDDAEPEFQELLKLSQDIQGSIYAFYSGLTVEAQSQVETMLDKYQLANQT